MNMNMRNRVSLLLAGVLLMAPAIVCGSTGAQPLGERVRHELLMLPYYSLFDSLSYQVKGNKVVLSGEVTRPVLKSDAENVVKRIPGVASVENKIEVLPLSPFDNQTRLAELRAIYGNSALFRYRLGPIAPIRIIVKNGHVTLEGVVDSKTDKDIAGLAANGVPGVFSVTNNLVVKSS
jgi:hyperosmotically inducible protein